MGRKSYDGTTFRCKRRGTFRMQSNKRLKQIKNMRMFYC